MLGLDKIFSRGADLEGKVENNNKNEKMKLAETAIDSAFARFQQKN